MTRVKFATISELDKQGIALVREAAKTKSQLVITKRGKPVGLMRKVMEGDRGRTESLTHFVNKVNELFSSIEKGGSQIIITRYDKPFVLLKRISSKAFSIKE